MRSVGTLKVRAAAVAAMALAGCWSRCNDHGWESRALDRYEAVVGARPTEDFVRDSVGRDGSLVCEVDYDSMARYIADTEDENGLILRTAVVLELCPEFAPSIRSAVRDSDRSADLVDRLNQLGD